MASPPRGGGAPRVECFARARLGLGGTALHQAALERETPDGVDALQLDDREDDVRILSAGSRAKTCAKARGWSRSMRAAASDMACILDLQRPRRVDGIASRHHASDCKVRSVRGR